MVKNIRKVVYLKSFTTPAIILQGKHLLAKGYKVGDLFEVQYLDDKIIITKAGPEYGKQYQLTGAPEEPCIMNGNTWKESEVAN